MWIRTVFLVAALCVSGLGHAEPPKILVLGDSLSAAYGIPAQQGWVMLLQQRLQAKGYPHRVVNASVSGDTTAGGRGRLADAIRIYRPQIVLIELGGNDGLRGLPVQRIRENLLAIVQLCQSVGAKPLVFEMRVPENYGKDYGNAFNKIFTTVAKESGVPLVPFFLNAIAKDPKSFQDDGIHPIAAAQPKLLNAVWPTLEMVLLGKAK